MLPERKHPRLKSFDYRSCGHYFVTINTKNNLPVLAKQGYNPAEDDCENVLTMIGKTAKRQLSDVEIRYSMQKLKNML